MYIAHQLIYFYYLTHFSCDIPYEQFPNGDEFLKLNASEHCKILRKTKKPKHLVN